MFKKGQIVVFKSWERMEKEYGLCRDYIRCMFNFTNEMKFLCGKQFRIEDIRKHDKRLYGSYYNENRNRWESPFYSISTDMICEINKNKRIE